MNTFWSGKRLLVPDGAGVVGSAVAGALVARRALVRVIDNASSGDWSCLASHAGLRCIGVLDRLLFS